MGSVLFGIWIVQIADGSVNRIEFFFSLFVWMNIQIWNLNQHIWSNVNEGMKVQLHVIAPDMFRSYIIILFHLFGMSVVMKSYRQLVFKHSNKLIYIKIEYLTYSFA